MNDVKISVSFSKEMNGYIGIHMACTDCGDLPSSRIFVSSNIVSNVEDRFFPVGGCSSYSVAVDFEMVNITVSNIIDALRSKLVDWDNVVVPESEIKFL